MSEFEKLAKMGEATQSEESALQFPLLRLQLAGDGESWSPQDSSRGDRQTGRGLYGIRGLPSY